MDQSGLLKAGRILVLIGAIMSALGAVMLAGTAIGLGLLPTESDADAAISMGISIMYGVFAIMLVAGSVLGFLSHRNVGAGRIHTAWIQGLVASLLPPLQVLLLVGAILVYVSPEHEAERA